MAEPIQIAEGVACLRTSISNVCFLGQADAWVLVDTGVAGYADSIFDAAAVRFGAASKPRAILLTHGHYDNAGCALELARRREIAVYAHPLEFPYLTGKSDYPQKDPTVGGAMGFLSRFFPSRTVRITGVLRELPELVLPGWTVIHTPGHSPGHVSFWRESDRVLVAGDVVSTADLDSWRGMLTQKHRVSRPPAPFTYDWEKARESALCIAGLKLHVLACSHGDPMVGADVADELSRFAGSFDPPKRGRYVAVAARADAEGVAWEPPAPRDNLPRVTAAFVAGVFLVAGTLYRKRGRKASEELK